MKALACILVATLGAAWPWTSAAALQITFDDLVSVGNPVVAQPLDTHGYQFTSALPIQSIDTPGVTFVSNGPGVYLGQALAVPGITMTRQDGAPFSLYDFDAAGLFVSALQNAHQVSVVGVQADGTILTGTYTLSTLASFTQFTVPASWQNLSSVTFSGLFSPGMAGALAVDDISVGSGPSVPEPGTLVLALTTALAIAGKKLGRRHLTR
ncbi:MAG TPA: hypothetical protein VEH80_00455 [Candidatus Bathyarchaeia archaeon]|nr:hypothetical protein [Candidatus Bathyarchaeia archaeon]